MGSSSVNRAQSLKDAATEGILLGALVLLISAVLGVLWLTSRLLEIDEYLSFYTDSQPTVARLLAVQLHYPISLDPPTYHLLSHLAMRLFGAGAFALRLPALLGFLLAQLCLLLFVRRLGGWRAGVLAAAFPLITFSFFYAVQGRPYGLLIGLYGLALVCWQSAIRSPAGAPRLPALIGLATAFILGVTSHFFGVLILVPVAAGELVRFLRSRHVDHGIAAALLAGFASIAIVLPFERSAAVYGLHYYMSTVSWRIIPQAYAALFYPHHTLPLPQQHLFLSLFVPAELCIFTLFVNRWRRQPEHSAEFAALAALLFLPFFEFLIGHFVTHTADVRYVIATLFANAACFAIAVEPLLRRRPVFYLFLIALLAAGTSLLGRYARGADAGKRAFVHRFDLNPEVAAALAQDPGRPIYMQSLGDFYKDAYYEPNPAIRARFSLVYSQEAELAWLQHDTNYLTARNMEHFAPLSMTPYSALLSHAGPHPLVLHYRDSWDWLSRDLDARHIPYRSIGPMMDGELVELDLQPAR